MPVRLTYAAVRHQSLGLAGEPNRAIARKLEIARRTVEAHRAQVMKKMQAKTVQALMRMLDVARVDDKTFDEYL